MIDDKVKRTLKCMILGSLFYNIVLFIVSFIIFVIFCRSKNISGNDTLIFVVKNEICVLIGFICSIVGLYSMATSLSKAVSANDEKSAKRHMILTSGIRLLAFCVILTIIINGKTFGVIGGIMYALAVLGIKFGAYLAPVMEKKIP